MNAEPVLLKIAKVFQKHRLEAVMIGNAAAALQGAPVTTVDIDFMFRSTSGNLQKLKSIAKDLGATIFRPYYPASKLFRLSGGSENIQIDFMSIVHGVKSFASLRSRAHEIELSGSKILVADLKDVIASKKSARRPQDIAVLPVLEKTLVQINEKRKKEKK